MDAGPTEVLVVGAGPTGLALALDLRRRDVDVTIIDQRAEPATTSRAFALHARGLEILEDLGAGGIVEHTTPVTGATTHVAGHPLTRVRLGGLARHGHPGVYLVSQADVEAELRRCLEHLGARVQFGHQLIELEDLGHSARATILSPDGPQLLDCRWIAGCDGANSTVREQAGIAFEGDSFRESFLLADLDLVWPFDDREIANFLHPEGVAALFPLPGTDHWRLVAEADGEAELPDDEQVIIAMSQRLLDTRTGRNDIHVRGASWWSRFRIHRRLAARYRAGRVILAGDAAHVHSPFGGQGMNVGLGDAGNLGWKLAAFVHGHATAALLDSYEDERRPVAEQVVDLTSAATRVVVGRSAATRFVRDRVLPAVARARSDRPTGTISPPNVALERFSQLGVRYRHGLLAGPEPGISGALRRVAAGSMAGDRAPDGPVVAHARDRSDNGDAATQTTLRRLVRADWALLCFGPPGPEQEDAAAAMRHHFGDGVRIVRVLRPAAVVEPGRWRDAHGAEVVVEDPHGALHRAYGVRGSRSVVVRPDGHIGWRSHTSGRSLDHWLRRAFGDRSSGVTRFDARSRDEQRGSASGR